MSASKALELAAKILLAAEEIEDLGPGQNEELPPIKFKVKDKKFKARVILEREP